VTTELATTQTTKLAPVTYARLDQNPAAVYLASLSQGSRRTMRHALDTIADMLTPGADAFTFLWAALRYQHTQAIRTQLAERYAPATANKMLTAMRNTLKEAWRLEQMTADEYQRAVDLKAIKGEKAAQAEKGRHLTQGELAAMLATCTDGSAGGARDAALIAIGYLCGLRRAELVGLQLSDYNAEHSTLTVRAGKGNKERIVPVLNGAADALLDWLHVRGRWAGPLFTRVLKGDHVTKDGIVEQTVYDVLARRAAQAGVKEFSPHDLRRTFAGDLLDAGADIATVQKLMGHANVTTTAGYDRRDSKAKRAAVNKLHIAYRRQWRD
jgi:integrase